MKPQSSVDTHPGPMDWALFAIIVAVGGSSFAMIRGAVDTAPPIAVSVGRLWVGAIFLYIVMRQAGRRLPALFVDSDSGGDRAGGRRINREWAWIGAISLVGYVMPFAIFPWAQQFIPSGLAGIYMAFMPIWTVVLAFVFAGEKLTAQKIAGFAMGFVGVVILIGPGVIGEVIGASLLAQASLLLATLGYASAAVLTRKAPPIRPRAFAAATLLCAAAFSTPLLFFTELNFSAWSTGSILSIIGLGLGPTGLAGVLLIILIQRVGAGFMALSNYITPLWAVALGAALFGERLGANALVALGVILLGVAISQRGARATITASPVTAQKDRPDQTNNAPR